MVIVENLADWALWAQFSPYEKKLNCTSNLLKECVVLILHGINQYTQEGFYMCVKPILALSSYILQGLCEVR